MQSRRHESLIPGEKNTTLYIHAWCRLCIHVQFRYHNWIGGLAGSPGCHHHCKKEFITSQSHQSRLSCSHWSHIKLRPQTYCWEFNDITPSPIRPHQPPLRVKLLVFPLLEVISESITRLFFFCPFVMCSKGRWFISCKERRHPLFESFSQLVLISECVFRLCIKSGLPSMSEFILQEKPSIIFTEVTTDGCSDVIYVALKIWEKSALTDWNDAHFVRQNL